MSGLNDIIFLLMEQYIRQNIDKTFEELEALSDEELDKRIGEASMLLFEGLRSYVEGMTCCSNINYSHLSLEGTMDWQNQNFKLLCFERMRRYAKKHREECSNGK